MVGKSDASFRLERAESSWLAWGFGISLALHLLIFGGYQTGKKFGWWQNWQLPRWARSAKTLAEMLKKKEEATQPQPREVPLMFVDVNPAQAVTEPPKSSQFYSGKNSQAANPDIKVDSEAPNITGKQTQIVKTEDVPRAKAFPLQPALPVEPAKESPEEIKPKSTQTPGDLAMAKPEPTAHKDPGEAARPKPRTLVEANALAGKKMKQEGGVKRRGPSALDVTATGFGKYDEAFIAAVQNRWFALLDNRNYAGEGTGKVTVRFLLHSSGSVSEMTLKEYTVDYTLALLCSSAIEDNTPYAVWPSDMRREIGADYREVTFTFFYN